MRVMAIIGLVAIVTACGGPAEPGSPASSASWAPLPAPSDAPYPVAGSADAPMKLDLGEPLTIEGFLYEVVELRRWDRSTSDEGWCLAVKVHEERPDPDAADPLIGWAVRDDSGEDHFFDFGCQDGTGTPERPHELGADELQAGMAEGNRYWIIFDVTDAATHLWLYRTREIDSEPVFTVQIT